jgi:hypothetical protein
MDINFLQRHGLPACSDIVRVQGDGSRPAALITFAGVELEKLYEAAFRVDGLSWNSRSLTVQVVLY